MQRQRFWFGVALSLFPALMFALMFEWSLAPRSNASRGGPLQGDVKIHGHPMSGGFIVFVPDDPKSNMVIGTIDEKGHYTIRSRWIRDTASPTRFRICLIPKAQSNGWDRGIESDEPAAGRPARQDVVDGGPMGIVRVAAEFPHRVINPRTSGLKAQIGPDATRVDITL